MMRYVAIGGVVGFLIAYFLLSSGREVGTPLPVQTPTPRVLPATRPTMDQMRQMQQLPPSPEGTKSKTAPQ